MTKNEQKRLMVWLEVDKEVEELVSEEIRLIIYNTWYKPRFKL